VKDRLLRLKQYDFDHPVFRKHWFKTTNLKIQRVMLSIMCFDFSEFRNNLIEKNRSRFQNKFGSEQLAQNKAQHLAHGLATAEYAIVAIAATAFAGLLIVILKSDTVKSMLEGIIQKALNVET